jgi:hypothetical protein
MSGDMLMMMTRGMVRGMGRTGKKHTRDQTLTAVRWLMSSAVSMLPALKQHRIQANIPDR